MNRITILKLAATLTCVCGTASGAFAAVPFYTNYNISSQYAVSDIAILEDNQNGGSVTNSFAVPANSYSTITNPFVENLPVTGAFLLGVAKGLSSDNGDGQSHLVLFANDLFSEKAENVAFGTLFPHTTEESLINALEVIGQNVQGDTNAAYSTLFSFKDGDAANSPNGSASFQIGDPFEEIAFSNGQIIGGGTSFATPAAAAAVPETATWAMMILGFGVVGFGLRRARKFDERFTGGVRALALS